jgi:CubicO group peptidase (beta-lactamase class C family)
LKFASGIWSQLWNFGGTPTEARRLLLEKLTVIAPNSTPGTRYEYSNAGFALAGHMLETTLNKPWEDLMREWLFQPLDMASGGFGVPATPRMTDQPWGHQLATGKPLPIEPGTSADNPPAIGPAGTVHCSVADLAKYVAVHLAGEQGETELLKQSSARKLHSAVPNNSNYAYGWIAVDRPWAGSGKARTHNGSNTRWFSVIWMAPARQFGVVALCNLATSSGANPGATATDQIAGKMIQEFLQ